MAIAKDPEARFWKFIRKTPTCWLWQGKTTKGKYGLFRDSPTTWTMAHRFSWRIRKGAIPEGLLVLHECDTPDCVNPDHLFLGTYQDNVDDMLRKGRGMVGRRKLSKDQVDGAKELLKILSQDKVAVLVGASQGTISKIARGIY